MIRVDQLVMHDPDSGIYGDCMRACIVSILEVDPNDVPHFLETGSSLEFVKSLNSYLASFGLFHLETAPVNFGRGEYINAIPCYHMIYGKTERGTRHAVVALDGLVVHDPHPSRAGLLDGDDGELTFGFLISAGAITAVFND